MYRKRHFDLTFKKLINDHNVTHSTTLDELCDSNPCRSSKEYSVSEEDYNTLRMVKLAKEAFRSVGREKDFESFINGIATGCLSVRNMPVHLVLDVARRSALTNAKNMYDFYCYARLISSSHL